jgi:hypothetical protein
MSLDINAVQAQIVTMLIAANVCGGRVYDEPPVTSLFPYTEISSAIDTEDDSTSSDGVEHTMTLNIWSEWRGQKEVKAQTQLIRTALHGQAFDAADMHVIMWLDNARYFDSPDGVGRQAVINVRCNCRT